MAAGDYAAATRHHVREARPELETTDSCFDEIDQLLWRAWLSHQQLFLNDAYCARIAFGQRSGYE
jgi:Fe-S cluster biosynthesis and repair protein YggX